MLLGCSSVLLGCMLRCNGVLLGCMLGCNRVLLGCMLGVYKSVCCTCKLLDSNEVAGYV